MSTALTASLILLVIVIICAIIAITIYLVKLLIEMTLLVKNIDETTTIVKKELEPILGELTQTMKSINTITQNAGTQMATVKKVISTVIGFFTMFAGKFKFLQSSFMKGFLASFNLFRKR